MKPTVIMTVFLASSVVSLEAQEQVAAGNTDGKSCGDSNGDGKVDISDAIRMLMYIFNGGPPPVCPASEPAGDDDRTRELEQMLIEKGDASFAVTSSELLVVDGTPPHLLEQAQILLEPNGNSALVHVDGGQRKVSVVYLGSALELLDLVLILKDSGDPIETIEDDSGNPIEITYRSSDCIGAVICDTSCRVVMRSREKTFSVSETPVEAPKKCERVEQEDKTCTDKLKTICLQQLHSDQECTTPLGKPSEVNGWRCN